MHYACGRFRSENLEGIAKSAALPDCPRLAGRTGQNPAVRTGDRAAGPARGHRPRTPRQPSFSLLRHKASVLFMNTLTLAWTEDQFFLETGPF